MDSRGCHALRCAPGESTRGHNWVANSLLGLASLADANSLAEPKGIVPSRPGLRPADLLSFAAIGRGAALDVSIVSPDSEGAGHDACFAMSSRKTEKYGSVLRELQEEGIDYKPVVWTCWGRPGGPAQAAVRELASAAARRRGIADPRILEKHLNAIIGCFIWKRAACMVLACLGRGAKEDSLEAFQAAIAEPDSDWGGFADWDSFAGGGHAVGAAVAEAAPCGSAPPWALHAAGVRPA